MPNDPMNPYAPTAVPLEGEPTVPLDNRNFNKLKAIIKDANQLSIVILLSILCPVIGSPIIGVWYLVRLLQWQSLSRSHPLLLVENPSPGTIAANFQGARVKLIIGMTFGALMLCLTIAYIAFIVDTRTTES